MAVDLLIVCVAAAGTHTVLLVVLMIAIAVGGALAVPSLIALLMSIMSALAQRALTIAISVRGAQLAWLS